MRVKNNKFIRGVYYLNNIFQSLFSIMCVCVITVFEYFTDCIMRKIIIFINWLLKISNEKYVFEIFIFV